MQAQNGGRPKKTLSWSNYNKFKEFLRGMRLHNNSLVKNFMIAMIRRHHKKI